MKVGFKINLDSHHINHANSKLNIIPNYPELGIEVCYINKIIKELSVIYVRRINQFKFEHQTVVQQDLIKEGEDNQVLDQTELFSYLKINHNLTGTDIESIDSNPH